MGGAGDNAAAAVGTGIVRDGTAFTTIGTSGVVFAHTSKVSIDPKGRVHTCCCAVPGAWHIMGVTQGAGLSLKWFKDEFCQDYLARAEKEGCDVYDLINADVSEIPAGSNRLIYLPYLMGERTPPRRILRSFRHPHQKTSAPCRDGRCFLFALRLQRDFKGNGRGSHPDDGLRRRR